MRVFITPPTTVTATVVGGVLVAIFDGVPYDRKIQSVYVETEVGSAVEFYRGAITGGTLIGGNPIGNKNTYMPPNQDVIPAGFPFIVRWPNATSGIATARAVFEGRML